MIYNSSRKPQILENSLVDDRSADLAPCFSLRGAVVKAERVEERGRAERLV